LAVRSRVRSGGGGLFGSPVLLERGHLVQNVAEARPSGFDTSTTAA
jgi:hypothetical protein